MMTLKQKICMTFLIILSIALFISSIIVYFCRKIRARRMPEKSRRTSLKETVFFSMFIVAAIASLKIAVGFFGIIEPKDDGETLFWLEEVFNSIFKAFRTLGIDEGYASYIMDLKNVINALLPYDHWVVAACRIIVGVHATILDILSPIMGGAIVLEVISGLFPHVRLFFARCNLMSKKYYFSELNASSLALAKSISKSEAESRPVIIFTDTHIDDETEKDYELLAEAKRYGAICLREDLAHVKKCDGKRCKYYLMDENEFGNLTTLIELCEQENIKCIMDSEIYVFVKSDAYVQIEKNVRQKLEQNIKMEGKLPTIIPVDGYHNLVCNLFCEVPMYEPLIGEEDKRLNVTIFGNGSIGTEAFLNAYWFGQMLTKQKNNKLSTCDVTINIISKDEERDFWSKIDYVNPEIRESVQCNNNGINNIVLEYNSKRDKNECYCKVNYIRKDVKIGGFWQEESLNDGQFLNADYFIVALGNDADNISVAEKIRLHVGQKKLKSSKGEIEKSSDIRNTVITYAVFNSELAEALNRQKTYSSYSNNVTDIYMYAFGSMNEVYSCENVHMSKSKFLAEGIGNFYFASQIKSRHIIENENRIKKGKDSNYTYWADLARAMHVKYKVFSLGMFEKSIFDFSSEEKYKDYVAEQCDNYKRISMAKLPETLDEKMNQLYKKISMNREILAWLEHRRWNAFTRTMGFRYTDKIYENLKLNGKNPKNMELKLHPCLCEAKIPYDETYQRTDFDDCFEEFSDLYDGKDIDEMIGSLNKAKDFYIIKNKRLGEKLEKLENLDNLDKVTLLWCKEAARVNVERIDKEIERLLKIKAQESEKNQDRNIEKINFIFCYDYKMYDYYECEFNDMFSVREASALTGKNEQYVVKACENGKVKDAFCIGKKEWYVPLEWINDERKKLNKNGKKLNCEDAVNELRKIRQE